MLSALVTLGLAQACEPTTPTIVFRFGGEGLPQALEASLRREANYEAVQAGYCPLDDPTKAAQAVAIVDWPSTGSLAISIASTSDPKVRPLSRSLELSSIPADGYALSVGTSLGELLREARRELPGLQRIEPIRLAFGVWGSGEVFSGGPLHGGGDAFIRLRLSGRWWVEPAAGVRFAVPVDSTSGTIRSFAVAGAVSGLFELASWGRLALHLVGSVRFGWIRFEGQANALATAGSGGALFSTLRGGGELALNLEPVVFLIRVTGGAVVVGAAATDGGRRATSLTGFEGGLVLGFGGAF
jgi:hypothetical protein